MHKYSDEIASWLVEEGYTHCFFLAGGNIMHLLDSFRNSFKCIPVIHEAAAGMAVEYFNHSQENSKAFALVTAGPGLTNIVTPVAGAWQESRDLLVIGGQVKSTDLLSGNLRQRGIQEISGSALLRTITKESITISSQISKSTFIDLIRRGNVGRPGPVFLEICLDVQGSQYEDVSVGCEFSTQNIQETISSTDIDNVVDLLKRSERPVLLIGGGVARGTINSLIEKMRHLRVPVMCTFNGADRVTADYSWYFGRPNTWGQRYSNVLIQQADLLIAVGTRLGLQQTGFNWENFVPLGKIIQVDVDQSEIDKGHPNIFMGLCGDANEFIVSLINSIHEELKIEPWLEFAEFVKQSLPTIEPNICSENSVSPYVFWSEIGTKFPDDTIFIPSSSGGTFTTAYQAIELRGKQQLISNKSLASMGYGLSSAIGAALANPDLTVVLGEGDGGFAQNLQELGTVRAQNLNLKIFIFDNDGYASIRMTQKNYFGGEWVGCDEATNVGLPDWDILAKAYGIPFLEMNALNLFSAGTMERIEAAGPIIIRVLCDPEQTYFPKISSMVMKSGKMESNPLHLMHPTLDAVTASKVLKFFEEDSKDE